MSRDCSVLVSEPGPGSVPGECFRKQEHAAKRFLLMEVQLQAQQTRAKERERATERVVERVV